MSPCPICDSPVPKGRKYCAPACSREAVLRRNRAAWDPEKGAVKNRERRLKHRYGISVEDYDRLFEAQGGVCAICGRPPKAKRLAVDHDHRTGELRGLLCTTGQRGGCNYGLLGGRDRDPGLFRRAYEYLTDPPARRVLDLDNPPAPAVASLITPAKEAT